MAQCLNYANVGVTGTCDCPPSLGGSDCSALVRTSVVFLSPRSRLISHLLRRAVTLSCRRLSGLCSPADRLAALHNARQAGRASAATVHPPLLLCEVRETDIQHSLYLCIRLYRRDRVVTARTSCQSLGSALEQRHRRLLCFSLHLQPSALGPQPIYTPDALSLHRTGLPQLRRRQPNSASSLHRSHRSSDTKVGKTRFRPVITVRQRKHPPRSALVLTQRDFPSNRTVLLFRFLLRSNE